MTVEPQSHHDWTVRALNIHGAIFERWTEHVFRNAAKPWTIVATQYPVEFPPPIGPSRGRESVLDVWGEYRLGERWLSMLVECKKNDPRFVDWVFFPAGEPEANQISMSGIQVRQHYFNPEEPDEPRDHVEVVRMVDVEDKERPLAAITNEARETRGKYEDNKRGDFTRTSTKAIHEAAHQVALATQAITSEQVSMTQTRLDEGQWPKSSWRRRLILPAIVTTAHLYVAELDPAKINQESGTIEPDNVTLHRADWLWYLYPLPRHLQFSTTQAHILLEEGLSYLFTKLPIAVIRSAFLPTFLEKLPTNPSKWVLAEEQRSS